MKINCELPLCMLDENNTLNDYDFVLLHLLEDNLKYREYFINQRQEQPERPMILDNSAYEYFFKNQTLDTDRFIYFINMLTPDFFVLPEVFGDMKGTLTSIETFMHSSYKINSDMSQFMFVPQGQHGDELAECLKRYKSKYQADAVAIPFHMKFFAEFNVDQDIQDVFLEYYENITEDIKYAMGRVQWVRNNKELLKSFKYVHMLGSHCPVEIVFYKDFASMDTGYPVKLGIVNGILFQEKEKPNIIIDDFLDSSLPTSQQQLIKENILKFKTLIA